MLEDVRILWLSCLPGMNRTKIRLLVEAYPSADALLDASASELRGRFGLTAAQAEAVAAGRGLTEAEDRYFALEEAGIAFWSMKNPAYPWNLSALYDPPVGIYVKGDFPSRSLRVAVIGARRCSRRGMETALRLGYELAEGGASVVSGMARGIDGAGQRGCLKAGGEPVAVLGCGFNTCYPPEHQTLMARIAERGCLVSEYPPEEGVRKYHFPERNRIIAALSHVVAVVEAGARSGTTTTVYHALELGAEVFAVPGPIYDPAWEGGNRLLRDGASVATCAADILDCFRLKPDPKAPLPEPADKPVLATDEKRVYDCIRPEPTDLETILAETELSVQKVQQLLTVLEVKGYIQRLPGTRYLKV